jgi:hypothetical protein
LKKILRYTIRIAGAILCLLLLIWVALAVIVSVKKASLLEKARTEIKDHLGADVQIGQLEISLFRHFPSITLQLSDVSIRDSLWQQHHHDLLQAKNVFVSCPIFRSLIDRKVQLGKVFLEHGTIYFYRDSTGYSNTYIFQDRKPASSGKPFDPPDVALSDMKWVEELQDKHKLFDLEIRRLDCGFKRDGRVLQIGANADITVKSFAFNTDKGSFLRDKRLTGKFALRYNTASKIVQFAGITLAIDRHPYTFTGRFFPSVSPDPFFLTIETTDVPFHQVTALLTPNIQQKLDEYDIDKPVSIHAQLDAGAADDPEPQIQVRLSLDKGSVLTPIGRFTETSFRASFTNEWLHGHKRDDENSAIRLLAFSGRLQNMPLRSDTITITNLKHPGLASDIHSRFELEQLNTITGSETLFFGKGTGNLNIYYKGPMSENDTAGTIVNGRLDIDSAAITYLPYQFQLTNGKGRLLFKDQDLFIGQLDVNAGTSRILVKGVAKNLVALLDRNSENVNLDLNLSAAHLAVEDFSAFAGKPSTATVRSSSQPLFKAAFERIDNLLKSGTIHVGIEAADLSYKKFSGAHAKADLLFDDHSIKLSRLTVEQGTGSVELKATLKRQGNANPLTLESHIEGVDVSKLFNGFNNFGQEAITAKNLKGRLTADVHLSGALTDKAKMLTSSLKGRVDFSLRQGQLLDFEPMQKIHEKVLKNKDLSEIYFAELKNQLDIDSTTMTVHRMEIRSTAFTLYAEGTYDLKTGADMSLQVPLSNLKKNKDQNPDIPPDSKGNDSKAGLSLRLRARTGDDGKLKVSWDPFKKALKKKK